MGDGHGAGNGARLRLARQARGFSQQQLAAMAGVSRQAGSFSPAPQVVARPVALLGGEGARVTLAPVGEGLIALPLSGATVSRAGFLPAGGLVTGRQDSEPGAGEQV